MPEQKLQFSSWERSYKLGNNKVKKDGNALDNAKVLLDWIFGFPLYNIHPTGQFSASSPKIHSL